MLVNLVKIVANSTGSGAITLGSAAYGYRGVEALTNGRIYSYSIQQNGNWEFGYGTYLSGGGYTFIRSPRGSSNGGEPIELAQNAEVTFTALAEDLVPKEGPAGPAGPTGPTGVIVPQFQRMISKLDNELGDVTWVVLSDSTADATNEWFFLIALELCARYPRYNVKYSLWSGSGYGAETSLQSGGASGYTINMRNASVAGTSANYHAGANFSAAVVQVSPDLVTLSYGHNGDADPENPVPIRQLSYFNGIAYALATKAGDVPVIQIGQNPIINAATPTVRSTAMQRKIEVLKPFAARNGYGFINVHDAFEQAGVPLASLMADNTHPNNVGQALWKDTVWNAFIASRAAAGAGALADGSVLRSWITYSDFAQWTPQNATVSQNSTNYETKNYSTNVTSIAGGGGNLHIRALGSADIQVAESKWVTFSAFMRVPIGNTSASGRIDLTDSGGTTVSAGVPQGNGFIEFTCTRKLTPGTTFLDIDVFPSETATSNTISLDRASLAIGLAPVDVLPPVNVSARFLALEGSGANGIARVYNSNSTGTGIAFYPTALATGTAWTLMAAADWIQAKQTGDAYSRVTVANNGVFFGTGAAPATMRFTIITNDTIGPNANWGPNSDNLYDLGGNGLRWKRVAAYTIDSLNGFYINGTKVLGALGTAIADPTGGATVDTEARAAITAILARMRAATPSITT